MRAPNPSPMTRDGTNGWLIGTRRVVALDPGPEIPGALERWLEALDGRVPTAIAVTHAHLDHAPLARRLARATGAPVAGFGPAGAGRSATMRRLARDPDLGGGEGFDALHAPDLLLAHGDTLETDAGPLTALHTPGHTGDHLCFALGDTIWSGDHVMGWAPSLVSPPDGDLDAYMASLRAIEAARPARLLPGHGDPVEDPAARIAQLRAHRLTRDRAILDALADGPATPAGLLPRAYGDVPRAMWPWAERTLLAHLIAACARGAAACDGPPSPRATFRAARPEIPLDAPEARR